MPSQSRRSRGPRHDAGGRGDRIFLLGGDELAVDGWLTAEGALRICRAFRQRLCKLMRPRDGKGRSIAEQRHAGRGIAEQRDPPATQFATSTRATESKYMSRAPRSIEELPALSSRCRRRSSRECACAGRGPCRRARNFWTPENEIGEWNTLAGMECRQLSGRVQHQTSRLPHRGSGRRKPSRRKARHAGRGQVGSECQSADDRMQPVRPDDDIETPRTRTLERDIHPVSSWARAVMDSPKT